MQSVLDCIGDIDGTLQLASLDIDLSLESALALQEHQFLSQPPIDRGLQPIQTIHLPLIIEPHPNLLLPLIAKNFLYHLPNNLLLRPHIIGNPDNQHDNLLDSNIVGLVGNRPEEQVCQRF